MGIAVDERVVEMRFDNHQFERGVQSTMGALDKLKQSLKLDGASKGLDNVNQAAKNVSLDGIASGVAALEKRFSTFGIVGMRVISNLTDSMMRFGRNTVGFVTDSIIGGGKRRAMNIENAHFQLQGLLKDEAKVQAVMDDAMDSVDGTAYAYDEAAKAASQFAASGMEAGEKMQASLRAITGVAAMTNSEYESISQIFTTVSGNGRLMGDQLLQLSSRGLNAAATLADYMTKVGNGAKVTEGEVREMVSKGEISFDLFAAAMDDAFGEHAKKANETFTGAMSNVKASLSRIGAEFMSPLIVQNGPLVQFFNALRERINDVKTNIGPLAELFTKSVSGMAQSAAKYLQEMDLAKPFEAFYNIMDIFKNALGGISSILMPIRFAFEDIFPQSAVTALADFTSKLKEFTSNLRLSHVDAVNLRNTFQGLFAVLDIAGRIIGGVVQAIFPMTKGVGGLGSAVLMVTGQIGTWLTALDDIIKKSGVFGSAAEKIGNVTGVVSQAIGKHVKGIVKAFSDFLGIDFAAAAEARLNPFQKICEAVKLALDKLAAVFREISPVLAKFGEMIVDTLGKIGGGLQKAVHGEGFDSLIDLMNGGLMAGIGTGIMNFIGHIQKTVIKANGMFSNVNLILANVKNTLISYQAALKADVLMKIAKAVAVLAGSLFVLALIDSEKLSGALAALSVLVVELSAAMAAFGKTLGGKGVMQLASAGTMMLAFSTAILILSAALNVISSIDSDKLTGALIGITVLLGELLASSIILSKWGGKVKTSAAGMILFASAIYILTKAVKQLAQLDVKQLTKGLIGVGVLLAELSAFMFAAKFGNFKVSSGLAMIELAAALLILEKVVSGFGQMNTESMARGLAGVAGALLAVSASMRIMPKNMIALGLGLIEVSAALKIIGEVVQETGKMGWEEIGKGLTVLSGSMVILAVALQAMKGTLGAAAAMLVLSIALNVFLPCLKALGSMSLVEIGTAILALAAAFTVLGIAGAVLGPLIPAILGLSGALALFGIGVAACGAGVLALSIGLASLAASGVAGMMAFVTGLEILFVGILEIIAKSVESIANAVKAVVLAIVSVVVECAPAIVEGVLALVEEVFKALSVHAPAIVNYLMDFLIGVMNALAERLPELVQAAINLIRTFFHSVIEVLKGMDTSSLVEMVEGIGFLTAIMYALAGVAKLTPLAMKGVLGLGVVIAELAAVLAALGGLAQIPYLEWLISEGGDLLKEIGTAIGKFIGGIVGGLMSGVSSALPQIGSDLSQFMENAAPFFMGMGMITADTLAKAGFLSGILLIFGAADLIAGITSFLTGGSSLPQIGTNLSDFLLNATPFFSGLALVNEGAVKAAKNLAEMIMLFTVSDFIQGITSWLTGGSSLADFGTELVAFGPSIAEFAETVKDVKPKAVKGAASAAKIMAEVADNLPGQDGLLQKIFGDKSLADFGSELLLFGPSIALFAETVKDVKPKAVKGAAAAASIMSEMASELPETGGLKAVIFGDCTLSDFGAELVAFAPQIKKYADEVADVKPEAVTATANAAKVLSELTDSLPKTGGISEFFTGKKSLSNFGENLKAFGEGMSEYSKAVKEVDSGKITASANAAKALLEIVNSLPETGGISEFFTGKKSLSNFGENLKAFGEGMSEYSKAVKEVDSGKITASANAAQTIAELVKMLPETGGISEFFTGEQSLSNFSGNLKAFGEGMSQYSKAVKEVDSGKITASANAAQTIAELVDMLPETDSVKGFFTGEKSLSNFSENLKAFGKGMSEYSKAVKEVDSGKITASANAAQTIAELVDMLPETDSVKGFFTGEKSLSNFSENLKAFGEGMSEYSKAVEDVNSGKIVMSTNAAQTIAELVVSSSNIEKFNLAEFGKDLAAFGQSFVKYYKDTSDIDPQKLSGITSEIKKLAKMASSGITKGFSDGMKTKQSAVSDIFSSILEKALSVIKKKRSNFGVEGSAVINKFVSAVKKGGNDVKTALSVPINQSLASIRNKRPAFYSAASFLVDGFVKGVSDNASKVSKQIQLMAESALTSAQTALGIHSPSKVFTEIGGYVVDGFSNGIDLNKEKAAKSAEALAEVGVQTAKSVLESLKDSDSIFAEYVETVDENGEAVEVTLEQAAEAFKSFRNSVKDSIKDATGMFDEFKTETDIAGKQLIKNLKSQITGITEWAENMQLLAARGVNQGLLKALSDMGPSGANYVNALVTMSGKELKKMNKLYKQRLSLNDKAADEIASSFVEGGKKAAKAYDKGLTKGEMVKSGKKSLKTLAEDSVNAVSNARRKVKESFGGMFEDAVKEMKKSLDYGKGAFQQFCNIFLSGSKNIVASANAVEAASKAITAYGKKLYEESEYYKEDTKNLKAHTDSLTKLQNENSKLQKQLKKAKKSNKKDSKERVQTLKKELEANKKAISSAKDQIISDQKEIAKHTKEVYNNLRSDLSNSVAAFLDPLKASLDSGVDLFKKFESNATLYEEDKKRLAEHQKTLADLEKQRAGLQEELAKYAEMNDTDSRLRWKELYGELEELETQIEDAKNNIKQDEDDMASHSQLTVNKILENMQSQVTGVKQWKGNINKLAGKGVSEGLIAYLKNMGTDGVDYVDQFMKMTSAEISKANAIFKESQNLSAQSLLDGFKDQMKTANDFANGLNQMAKMGFGQDLLDKLGEAGPDSYDYVKAFLTMTPQQVAEFNQEYANSLKLPNTVADKVISSFAYAGSQSAAGFTSALAKMSETGSKENAALVTATNRIGESIGVMLKSNSRTAGSDMVGELAHTLKVKKPTAEKESLDLGKATLKSVKKSISKKKGKKLAKNLVDGMSNGLTDHSSRVSKTAEEVALSAYRAAKKALGIKSPSKMFAKLGAYTDAGFIEGLASGEKDVCQTASDIMGQAIKEASDLLQSDMDTEPTIRPVMDLTEIQNGVGSIGELMNDCGVSASAKLAGFAAGGIQKPGMSMEDKNAGAISRLQETLSNLLDKPAIEQHNTFTITGNDPRAIADEVSCILQKQVERRSAVWA